MPRMHRIFVSLYLAEEAPCYGHKMPSLGYIIVLPFGWKLVYRSYLVFLDFDRSRRHNIVNK